MKSDFYFVMICTNEMTEHFNTRSVELIGWDDIIKIEAIQVALAKIIMLETDKPDKCIEGARKRNFKFR